jgi:hypothetical protein
MCALMAQFGWRRAETSSAQSETARPFVVQIGYKFELTGANKDLSPLMFVYNFWDRRGQQVERAL